MSLDVETPDSPPLWGPQGRGDYAAIDMTDREPDDDYRREEIAAALQEGAWRDAFQEWAEHTYLTAAEFERVRELGLLQRFDFYWDPSDGEVGYQAPAVDRRDAVDDPDGVEEELDGLGRVVSETLENDYLGRDPEGEFGFFAQENREPFEE
jgi:hypothetical protein